MAEEGRQRYGFELPLLLFAGFRSLIDELHTELARHGHPDARPLHGFALQGINAGGASGVTATELGRRLGVTKQAAGKTVDRLEALGYARRLDDPADARRKVITVTPLGIDMLRQSAQIFEDVRARWAAVLGADELNRVEDSLGRVVPETGFPLDAPGWLGT